MDSIHKGHKERIREEFRRVGIEHMPDHKVLELLLSFSITRKDTNPAGHRLIEKFGSIKGVIDAPYELLCEVTGVGATSATLIKLVAALIKAYHLDNGDSPKGKNINMINSHDAAEKFMEKRFIGEQRECIYVACMGNNGLVLYCEKVADGAPDSVSIVPSNIIKTALRANAVKMIIAHNHPNGICNPSSQDIRTTSILFEELRRVDIELVDHIIVAPDGVYSMRRHHMFPGG